MLSNITKGRDGKIYIHYTGVIFQKLEKKSQFVPLGENTMCMLYDSIGPKMEVHKITDKKMQMNKIQRIQLLTYVAAAKINS
jgi:hypothetical protein